MSGIDEQDRVPQCPKCNRSQEIRVGDETWVFPKNARVKRGLKYSLYSRHKIDGKVIPDFYSDNIICGACGTKYNKNTDYYNNLRRVFNRCVIGGKYYDNEVDFERDDDASVWDRDGNFDMEWFG